MGVGMIAPIVLLIFQFSLFHFQTNNPYLQNIPDSQTYLEFQSVFQEQSIFGLGVGVLISLIASLVLGIVISHRVAGPMVKLKKHFENVAQDPEKSKARSVQSCRRPSEETPISTDNADE